MAEITGVCHHAQLIFVILVEIGFHHVVQVSLELLTSCDPLASASLCAGITGVSPPLKALILSEVTQQWKTKYRMFSPQVGAKL